MEANGEEVLGRPMPRDAEDRRGAYAMVSLTSMTTTHDYANIRSVYRVDDSSKRF